MSQPFQILRGFSRASAKMWRVSEQAPSDQRSLLVNGPDFAEIVRSIKDSVFEPITYRREQSKEHRGYYRLCATLTCRSALPIALFHSAATGYRAQYFLDPRLGEQANRFAAAEIGAVVMGQIASAPKRTCADPWLQATVGDDEAKVWIHQGRWLRSPKRSDKLLHVTRWAVDHAQDLYSRKRRRYAQLVPWTENRLEFKGGFATLDGRPLGTLKPDRTRHLHEEGFT